VQFLPPDLSHELDDAQAQEIAQSIGFLDGLNQAHATPRAVKSPPLPPAGTTA
jgi:hypothetical protein